VGIFIPGVRTLAGILAIGLMYYGFGYVLFALGALYWLRCPRDPGTLHVAAVISPLLFAPIGALSIVVVGTIGGTGGGAEMVVPGFFLWAGLSAAVGFVYVIPLAAVGALVWKAPREGHAA
jgi:hypothetical protein